MSFCWFCHEAAHLVNQNSRGKRLTIPYFKHTGPSSLGPYVGNFCGKPHSMETEV